MYSTYSLVDRDWSQFYHVRSIIEFWFPVDDGHIYRLKLIRTIWNFNEVMPTLFKRKQDKTQVLLLDTVENIEQSKRYVKKLVGISYCYVSTIENYFIVSLSWCM